MNKAEAARKFGRYRHNLYLNIIERKDDLDYLKRSPLLSKKEKELLDNVINDMEKLRIEFLSTFAKAKAAKQSPVENGIS